MSAAPTENSSIAVIAILLRGLPILVAIVAIVGVVGMFFVGGKLLDRTTKQIAPHYRGVRESVRLAAKRAGWTWTPVGPAPTPEVVEAVFRMGQMPHAADRTTEIITGTSAGYAFRAAHIVQTTHPDFARDIVADFASIRTRLEILTGLASRIPAVCWNRSNPEMAGLGHYPIKVARPGLIVWEPTRVAN